MRKIILTIMMLICIGCFIGALQGCSDDSEPVADAAVEASVQDVAVEAAVDQGVEASVDVGAGEAVLEQGVTDSAGE